MSLEVQMPGVGSSRAGSTSSGLRLAERWYYDSTPPIPDQSDHFPYLMLDTRLRPRRDKRREESNPAPRLKRELSDDSSTSSAAVKNRRILKVSTQRLRGADQACVNSTRICETNTSASVPANVETPHGNTRNTDIQDNPVSIRETKSDMGLLKRQNDLLKREIDLISIRRDRKIVSLQENVTCLQEFNKELNTMLGQYREMKEVETHASGVLADEVMELRAKLRQRDEQLEGKIHQISTLDEQLSAHEGMIQIKEDWRLDFTCSSSFSKALAELEGRTRRLADMLAQCLSRQKISKMRKKPRKEKLLHSFVKRLLGTVGVLDTNPIEAMRALIFGFVRDRIFFSECWTALHSEGYILRELQQLIRKTSPPGTLESLHRASVESMLNDDHQFKHCWIQKEVEDTQTQFLRLFCPLFDTQVFEEVKHQITRDLGIAFEGAFEARARFIPPEGSRYRLLHFKAGEKFDPAYMKIEETNSKATSAISRRGIHRIKAGMSLTLSQGPLFSSY
ncbi:hypothetical protein CBS147332_4128 [Penicillium roqueforti]|nr:hypothetical protein CBS147332_4128 [Penicillium roqueforti]KAI3108989.1 hypothetical protein CBS147331_5781 [Penicillium roqueforti]